MITIGGSAMPTPSDYQVTLKDIEKTATNANGGTIIEIIATKRNISLSYKYLSQVNLATLLAAIAGATFSINYPDPLTGALRTGTFKKGDRAAGGIDYQSATMRWKDIQIAFEEV